MTRLGIIVHQIDWAKGPADATHWGPDGATDLPTFYKFEEGRIFYADTRTGWQWCELTGPLSTARKMQLVPRSFEKSRVSPAEKLRWLADVNTLHRQVDILYVVDRYSSVVRWDENDISPEFHGATVSEAIERAMEGFNLDAAPVYMAAQSAHGLDRQIEALRAQLAERDVLLQERFGQLRKLAERARGRPKDSDEYVLLLEAITPTMVLDLTALSAAGPSTGPRITDRMVEAASGVCIGFSGDYGMYNDYLTPEAAREVIEAALAARGE